MNKHEGHDVTWATPLQAVERETKLVSELLEQRRYDEAMDALVRQQAATARVAQWVLRETADGHSHCKVGA